MIKYYLLAVLATLLYSVQFVFTKMYQKREGDTSFVMMVFTAVVSTASLIYLTILNGFKIEIQLFSVIISVFVALSTQINRVFSVKLMARGSIALFSVFNMLGGMLVPFFYGVIALGDQMSVFKILAVVLIIVSIYFLIGKTGSGKAISVIIIVFGIITFFTNGFTGMLFSMHQKSGYVKVDEVSFNILCNASLLLSSLIAMGAMAVNKRVKAKTAATTYGNATENSAPIESPIATEKRKNGAFIYALISVLICVGYAAVHATADLIQTLCYNYLDVSVETTIITGGCLVFSTLSGMLFGEKPTLKIIISVVLAAVGTVFIVL